MTTHRAVPGLVIVVLVTLALTSVAMTVVGLRRDPAPQRAPASDPTSDPTPVAATRPEVEAAAELSAWDARRAAAWAAGDVRRLRSLYAPGSVAGERDVAMLQRWLDRGLVVDGLRTQLLVVREVSRTPGRWVMTVTDRVIGGVATGPTAQRLPVDAPTTRTVIFRKAGDRWLVSAVRPYEASPTRSTSATSRSWNS